MTHEDTCTQFKNIHLVMLCSKDEAQMGRVPLSPCENSGTDPVEQVAPTEIAPRSKVVQVIQLGDSSSSDDDRCD